MMSWLLSVTLITGEIVVVVDVCEVLVSSLLIVGW